MSRSFKRSVSGVVNLIGVIFAGIAVAAITIGPPILVVWVVAHFIIKFW